MEWERFERDLSEGLIDLYGRETKVVVGRGSRAPRVVFIGEAPGAEEDRLGLAFVGPSGRLLDSWIAYLGIGDAYYITNVVRCRPPGNRNPTKEEVALCAPYLDRQLALLDPEIIVCLGRFAMQHFFPKRKAILKESGTLIDGKFYIVPHPSFFLRRGGTGWEPYLENLRRHLQGEAPIVKQTKLL